MSQNGVNGAAKPLNLSEKTRAKWASNPEEISRTLPPMLDLTIENITENVMKINSVCNNPRLRFLIMKLIKASHDYIRDVGLQFDEWEQAWQFLTRVRVASFVPLKIGLFFLICILGWPNFQRCSS